jgi:hypothetical protein
LGAAARNIEDAARILEADSYLMEAAAAQLELSVLERAREESEPEGGRREGDASQDVSPPPAVADGILNAIRLIDAFSLIRKRASESFGYQLPQGLKTSFKVLPELRDLNLPRGDEILDDIKAGVAEIRSGLSDSNFLNVKLVRETQRKCHFWFDILNRSD